MMKRIMRLCYLLIQWLVLTYACWYINCFTASAQKIQLSPAFKHAGYDLPEIYVITNRQADTADVKYYFNNRIKNDPSLSFFHVNASRSDSLLLTALDSAAFIGEIAAEKKQDWVLFVHGDSKTFEEAALRGLDIQNKYHLRVIVFAWPSKDRKMNGLKNYFASFENVGKSTPHFQSVLKTMSAWRNDSTSFLPGSHLSLFLHSLGNYFLYCLEDQKLLTEPLPFTFDNIIINAAAVNQSGHTEWVEALQFQKRIFINSNRHDFNLNGLKYFTNLGTQLGQKVTRNFAHNAIYFNFSKSVGIRIPTGYSHTYYLKKIAEKKKNIHLLYSEMLHGLMPNLADESRFKRRNRFPCNFKVK